MPDPTRRLTAIDRLPARALLDGAAGTELMARGLRPEVEPPESWNFDRPDELRRLHADYFAAGAEVVTTSTFGANRLRLETFGRGGEVRRLTIAGALLAREVRPSGRLVAGSIGPTGAIPPPEGRADLGLLEECYAEQAAAFVEGGVDLLVVESMYHPKEARAAMRGIAQGAPGLGVVGCFTCRRVAGGYATHLGFSPETMLAAFLEEGADGVGVNCTLPPAHMLDLVRLVREKTDRPLFAKPTPAPTNSPRVSTADFAHGAMALFAAGANAVGGCCGSTPVEIAAIRKLLDAPQTLSL